MLGYQGQGILEAESEGDHGFGHVKLSTRRHRPFIAVNEVSQDKVDNRIAQIKPGAHPPSHTEGNELKRVKSCQMIHIQMAKKKPVWIKLIRIFIYCRIPVDCMQVENYSCP